MEDARRGLIRVVTLCFRQASFTLLAGTGITKVCT